MIPPRRLNRLATVAALPLMAVVIVIASRAVQSSNLTVAMPREGIVAVANLRSESLSFLHLANGETQTLALPGPPHELAFAGGRLYVTLGRANLLAEIDPYAPGILRTLALDGEPHGLAVEGDRVYVTLDRGNALVVIDRGTLTQLSRAPTGTTPHSIAVSGGVAFVTDSRDNRLRVNPGDASAATGAMPESVALAGTMVVTADVDSGTLSVFARDGLQPQRRVEVGGRPVRIIAIDEKRVLASLNADGRVVVVDVAKGKVERRLRVGGHPDGLCLSPSGAYLAVASNETDGVDFFRLEGSARAEGFAAGDGPGACAWLPAR